MVRALIIATALLAGFQQLFADEVKFAGKGWEVLVVKPDTYNPRSKYRVVYILPTTVPKDGQGVRVFQDLKIPNLYNVIVVTMAFDITPWYADNATDAKVRQESYIRDGVVAYIESKYSTLGTPEGRILIGFGKSGWGAFSLILRNPNFFGYAVSWDAPLMLDRFDPSDDHQMEAVFGSQDQLNAYRPDLLVPQKKDAFKDKSRLVLGGGTLYGTYLSPRGDDQTAAFHQLLDANGIKHTYLSHIQAAHSWNSIWVKPALQALLANPVNP